MSYRRILAPVINLDADRAALTAACELAERFDARATALFVAVRLASRFSPKEHPLSEVMADIAAGSQAEAVVERAKLAAWLGQAPRAFEIRDVSAEGAVDANEILAHGRLADLVVMARGQSLERPRRALLERLLFKSGRPVLLLPATAPTARAWRRFLVAWNATGEAVHAIAAAAPLLRQADEVVIATVDAAPSPWGHGEAPGRDLAAYLAAHDVAVTVRNVDGLERSPSRALLDEAAAVSADAIVMGAFGHSRAREFFLGGVTRDLMEDSAIPLFLAH